MNKLALIKNPLGLSISAALLMTACTTVDPYTGQQRIDYGATAGVVGLGLGAAALAVAADKDKRKETVIIDRRPGYYPGYRPPYRPFPRPRPYRR
ncbi:MAG: hypothetical protein Kow0065_09450 [Methylomicrobium sp.]